MIEDEKGKEFNPPFLTEEGKKEFDPNSVQTTIKDEELERERIRLEGVRDLTPLTPKETEAERIARERAEVSKTEEEILRDNRSGDNIGFVGDIPFNPPVPQDRPSSPQIAKIKEVPPVQPAASVEDHRRLTAAMRGRLESDIPLNDPYWDIRNQIIIQSRVP